MMRAVVVDWILHAPESGDAFRVERNMVGAAHFTERGFGKADFLCAGKRIKDVRKSLTRRIVSHQADGERFSGTGVMNQHGRDFAEFGLVLLDVFFRAV